VGTIISEDPAPEITIDDITIYEGGEGGPATASFTITMSNPTYEDVTVNWSVSPDTAALTDYSGPASGTATIAAGTTSVVVDPALTFTAEYDQLPEPDEFFNVTLDSVSGGGAVITDDLGVGTIVSASIASPTVLNGSIITNTNVQSQIMLLTFTDTTDPSNTFTTQLSLEEEGQQGNITLTEFAIDVGFEIDPDTEYALSLQWVSGPKIQITGMEIEGVEIIGQSDHVVLDESFQNVPKPNQGHILNITFEPATQNPDGTFGSDGLLLSGPEPLDYNAATVGTSGDDTLTGTAGDDVLVGDEGNDSLSGGDGNDALHGGPGADVLAGGTGNDTVTYFDSSAGVNINLAAGTASGGDATGDTLTGIENVIGSDDKTESDTLTGDSGDNVLLGLAGDDILVGGDGDDTLVGGPGNDIIDGGAGDDLIIGNADADSSLSGGSGADTFRYLSMNDVPDIIEDFDTTEGDVLDIAMVLDYDGSTPLEDYVLLDTTTSPGDTLVMVNPTGTGDPGDYEVLATLQGTPITDSVDDLVASGNLVVTEIF
jgi:Ca2+-binding RTX toxin-like protein